jgi:hypothetical protein
VLSVPSRLHCGAWFRRLPPALDATEDDQADRSAEVMRLRDGKADGSLLRLDADFSCWDGKNDATKCIVTHFGRSIKQDSTSRLRGRDSQDVEPVTKSGRFGYLPQHFPRHICKCLFHPIEFFRIPVVTYPGIQNFSLILERETERVPLQGSVPLAFC